MFLRISYTNPASLIRVNKNDIFSLIFIFFKLLHITNFTCRTPEKMICRFSFVLLEQGRRLSGLDAVEADVERLRLAVNDRELGAWLIKMVTLG